ncbi:hypothetical protein L218DRAFT_455534 [Marasmius fiardii PR-910]|nr:hypothetical protein L218DRAFT_455534 [Marasmius fiardii PR-910]
MQNGDTLMQESRRMIIGSTFAEAFLFLSGGLSASIRGGAGLWDVDNDGKVFRSNCWGDVGRRLDDREVVEYGSRVKSGGWRMDSRFMRLRRSGQYGVDFRFCTVFFTASSQYHLFSSHKLLKSATLGRQPKVTSNGFSIPPFRFLGFPSFSLSRLSLLFVSIGNNPPHRPYLILLLTSSCLYLRYLLKKILPITSVDHDCCRSSLTLSYHSFVRKRA